jgi:hypothetical protein
MGFSKKQFAIMMIIAVTVPGIMMYIQMNNIEPHDTGLFTAVKFSATNNDQVQLADRVKSLFGDVYFRYYDLPYTVEIYGSQVNLQYWFKERYRVNETFVEFEHGPFDITFDFWLSKPIVFELNKNNVTVSIVK